MGSHGALPGVRCGVDMIEVARVAAALARFEGRFLARFFTPGEQAACANQPRRLAARIAAKEAAAKLLGTGIGPVRWVDIEVSTDAARRPFLQLHGAARQHAAALGLHTWDVSLSHTDAHAIALVVALVSPPV